jgi:HEPN domain-containing protein
MSAKARSLLILAEEDFTLASQPTTPPRPAAYHLAQAAEKAARAVCDHAEIQVGPTHNIGQIGALLPDGHPLKEAIEAQNYHSSASTRYRYPDPAGRVPMEPKADEIRRRLADVRNFLDTVKAHIKLAEP